MKKYFGFTAVCAAVLLTGWVIPAYAQLNTQLPSAREVYSNLSPTSTSSATSSAASQIPEYFAENSIDPNQYYIGGGDVFSIHMINLPSVRYIAVIDQNCDAVIAELGIAKLGKKTLAEAKIALAEFINSKLKRQSEVYVSLTRGKIATITIVGAILQPSTYQVDGTRRLLDVIRIANNGQLPQLGETNYREIQVANNGQISTYDLFQYLYKNDLSHNPYIYPGDNILLKLATRRAYVPPSLAIRNSYVGYIPLKSQETASELISLFTLDESADSNNIIISQPQSDGSSIVTKYSFGQPTPITLTDRTIISISPKSPYPRIETVTISGEVNNPGIYPIQRNVTTAKNIIEKAGADKFGNPERTFIIRRSKVAKIETPQTISSISHNANAQSALLSSVRPEKSAALSQMLTSNDYAVVPISENEELFVEPTDEIVIPKIDKFVYVSGCVKAPGAYDYMAGKGIAYYVGLAGGYSSKADTRNSAVMTVYKDIFQIKEKLFVDEGDIIIVPESIEYKYSNAVVFPIVQIVLTVIGLTISTISAIVFMQSSN